MVEDMVKVFSLIQMVMSTLDGGNSERKKVPELILSSQLE